MPVLITPTTELEAVNAILASIGESPVNSLDDGEFVDATIAQSILLQESRRIQTHGWSFNEEVDVPLTPDTSGRIFLPRNTLRFIYTDDKNLVQRGFQLYDKANRTYTGFIDAITATLIVALPFDELPEALRQFITMRSGRRFQDKTQGDQLLHQFQAQDEMASWAAFLNYEAEEAQLNVNGAMLTLRLKSNR